MSVGGLLLGGGGLVAFYTARSDAKKGIRETDIAEETADANYLERVIQLQSEALFKPLQQEVITLRAEVGTLRVDLKAANHRIDELEDDKYRLVRRADAYEDYIKRLISHVEAELGPPAPERPSNLL